MDRRVAEAMADPAFGKVKKKGADPSFTDARSSVAALAQARGRLGADGAPQRIDLSGLQLGAAVKARSQGGDAWVAGSIAALNGDGTVDVLYEHSHTLEQGVPREFVQLVDGVAAWGSRRSS